MRATKLMVAFVMIALLAVLVSANWLSRSLVQAGSDLRPAEAQVRQFEQEHEQR